MKMHFELGFIFLTAFALGLSLYPVFIRLYEKRDIVDRRDSRKVHLNEVPTMGGVPIIIAFFVALFIWLSYAELADSRYIIGSMVFVLFIGLRDDFINLKPIVKLISQLVPALVIFYFTDIKITSFYGFISNEPFPLLVSLPITLITIIVITNSFNLIDGLDGLAGTITLFVLSVLGVWFSFVGEHTFGMLLFAMAGSIFAFLQYNWQPAKIFMGDTGALILGFLASISIIKFLDINYALPDSSSLKFAGTVATSLAILFIPLFDTLRIFTLRVIIGKSPFSADKKHLHHTLMKMGLSHQKVTLLLLGINIIIVGLAFSLRNIGDNILVPSLLGIGMLLSIFLDYFYIKIVLIQRNKDDRSFMEIIKSSKKAS